MATPLVLGDVTNREMGRDLLAKNLRLGTPFSTEFEVSGVAL